MVPGALTLALAAAVSGAPDRLLLCRPRVIGPPEPARADAVAAAGRALAGRFLDYGVPCEDPGEGARAARRAGLAHAVTATAEGRADASRYVLVLCDAATEGERARRTLEVAAGADAVRPVREALADLLRALPPRRPPGPPARTLLAWTAVGAGAAALAAGALLAGQARDAADRAGAARDPAAYTRAREEWRGKRRWSGVALGLGGAAVAGGLGLRFAF
jgi:hypothetical protein